MKVIKTKEQFIEYIGENCSIRNSDGTEIGVMITDIGPDAGTAERAVALLRENGVTVEEEA